MFKEVSSKLNLPQIEENILQFWKENSIFKKSLEKTKGKENFVFFEGPPTANGKPGIHHVMSRTVKDVVCRYKTMQGYYVNRKAGWDTHGLPVEIEVEKQLQLKDKEQIENYGIEKFNNKCRHSVFAYKNDWDELTERIGYWLDLDHPYITFENDYIESVWWILSELWKKNLLYKGFKILPYCPRCETPLSSHEVSQGYKEIKDPSIYVRVKLEDEPQTYFLVWTTTPWTLISNVALAVHPDVEYVRVRHENDDYIMAKARVEDLFESGTYEIINTFEGEALKGKRYERIFDFIPVENQSKAFYITTADFVTTEDGTGIVHIAPAFGEDDNRLGSEHDLPVMRPVDHTGAFTDEITDYARMFVKDADELIMRDLKAKKILVKKTKIEHSYPHCWRCDSPLLYYARESWYIRTSTFRESLLKNNSQINWYPKEVGEGRFGEWLKNNVDWSLSRDRYWGTPLNIWICDDCDHQHAVSSVNELFERATNLSEEDKSKLDLHKPYVDKIELSCDKCSGKMRRVPEVIDCWFDSGSMPIAQWHYPFENKETFEKNFPADFICEGIDQTRGWFYSLLAISTLLFDKPAYKNIVVNELILDKNGQKMSKSKGNVVVPSDMIQKYGADTIRWYLMAVSPPWIPKKFDPAGLQEIQRKFFNTLINTYSFFVLYANIDRFDPTKKRIPVVERTEIDRWIISRLYSVIDKVEGYYNNYELTKAARAVSDFIIDDVSNWYVRRNRRRFWKSENSEDKIGAYQTLYEVLITTVKMTAPFAPFISEEVYLNLRIKDKDEESVHLCYYPKLSADQRALIDTDLEDKMLLAQKVVTSARALRNEAQLKVRQPLSELVVVTKSKREKRYIEEMDSIIRDELNIKKVRIEEDPASIVNLKAKPNFKNLGSRAGKMMSRLNETIQNFKMEQIQSFLSNGYEHVSIDGHEFRLGAEDIIVQSEAKEGYVAHSDRDITIALFTQLSNALIEEGYAREFVNRIQNLRKEAGFEVTDQIVILVEAIPDNNRKFLENRKDYICAETLANNLVFDQVKTDFKKQVNIEDETFYVGLQKDS
ncbi:MAG: isoleucine--tRNA ligase [Caldithrix sp.]|nr:isoleucine--tRNA ligase [Caldithrix sp.]